MKLTKVILLVDDDETSHYINKRIIKKLDIAGEIITAKNGQEALDIMHKFCGQKQCPELILLDINMPVMDGWEFLEHFQKVADSHSSSLKIVLLSSSVHPIDVEKARKYPQINYVVKPLTEEKLLKYL